MRNIGWISESKVVHAKLGSPIGALAFTIMEPVQIRLFYLDGEDRLMEHCWVGSSWASGAVLPVDSIAANSKIACCGWDDRKGPQIIDHRLLPYSQLDTLRPYVLS